ncbi:hypothetical protein N9I00_01245 [bacterium]|nr:hypothetical protein [bacterium]
MIVSYEEKTFMDNLYNAIGSEVSGYYAGAPFIGNITSTRAKYGGDIQVVVEQEHMTYLIDGTALMNGGDTIYDNLHVYFN